MALSPVPCSTLHTHTHTVRPSSRCLHTSSARVRSSFRSNCSIFKKFLLLGIFSYFREKPPFVPPSVLGNASGPQHLSLEAADAAGRWAGTEVWACVMAEGGVVWFGGEASGVASKGLGHSPPSSLTHRPGMTPLSSLHAAAGHKSDRRTRAYYSGQCHANSTVRVPLGRCTCGVCL